MAISDDYERAQQLYYRAHAADLSGDHATAELLYHQSFELCDHPVVAFRLGRLLARRSAPAAGDWLRRGHEGNPGNGQYATAYAVWLIDAGDLDQARRLLRHTLKRQPTYGPAKRLLDQLSGDDS